MFVQVISSSQASLMHTSCLVQQTECCHSRQTCRWRCSDCTHAAMYATPTQYFLLSNPLMASPNVPLHPSASAPWHSVQLRKLLHGLCEHLHCERVIWFECQRGVVVLNRGVEVTHQVMREGQGAVGVSLARVDGQGLIVPLQSLAVAVLLPQAVRKVDDGGLHRQHAAGVTIQVQSCPEPQRRCCILVVLVGQHSQLVADYRVTWAQVVSSQQHAFRKLHVVHLAVLHAHA
mmetsp:Transcript_5800/g.12812  ORF Transcript_5800/g.12812 Transcript_5800/m.12812 type:complete len:232 (+) Transcript_5800:92-787(+)